MKIEAVLFHLIKSGGAMRRTILFLFPILFLAGSSSISGKDFWEKKDYGEWTQRESKKMLEDSPWAKTYTIGSWGAYEYSIQLRSALPIRQAIVRQMQIASKYDDLSKEQRQEFDKSAGQYLSASFPDMIVIQLKGGPNTEKLHMATSTSVALIRYWQTKTTELLKNTVFLIRPKGDKVPLLQYNVSQGDVCEFQFIFPRQHQGNPVLSPEDKSLMLEFYYPTAPSYTTTARALVEFKTKKMLFNGELEY
jgi:hypothetical protein